MKREELEAACAVVELCAGGSGGYTEGDPPNEVHVFPITAVESHSLAAYWGVPGGSPFDLDARNFPGGAVNVLLVRSAARDEVLVLFAEWLFTSDPTSKTPTIKKGKKVLSFTDGGVNALRQVAVRVGKALLAFKK